MDYRYIFSFLKFNIFRDVKTFQDAARQASDEKSYELHVRLVKEEAQELFEACTQKLPKGVEKEEVVREAIDLIYVTAGLLNVLIKDPEKAWERIHLANMNKLNGSVVLKDSKVCKPVGWKKAVLSDLL